MLVADILRCMPWLLVAFALSKSSSMFWEAVERGRGGCRRCLESNFTRQDTFLSIGCMYIYLVLYVPPGFARLGFLYYHFGIRGMWGCVLSVPTLKEEGLFSLVTVIFMSILYEFGGIKNCSSSFLMYNRLWLMGFTMVVNIYSEFRYVLSISGLLRKFLNACKGRGERVMFPFDWNGFSWRGVCFDVMLAVVTAFCTRWLLKVWLIFSLKRERACMTALRYIPFLSLLIICIICTFIKGTATKAWLVNEPFDGVAIPFSALLSLADDVI